MFADFVANLRGRGESGDATQEARRAEKSWAFRGYALWLTFPPTLLLLVDRPFALVIA